MRRDIFDNAVKRGAKLSPVEPGSWNPTTVEALKGYTRGTYTPEICTKYKEPPKTAEAIAVLSPWPSKAQRKTF